MKVFRSLNDLELAKGCSLGTSEWMRIDQARIQAFAEATGDFQWIHVDVDRAAAGPFGSTVAHGYLTLALLPLLASQIFSFEGWSAALNYGLEKVRFPHPVRASEQVRAHAELVTVQQAEAGTRIVVRYTVEIEGRAKPACVADSIALLTP